MVGQLLTSKAIDASALLSWERENSRLWGNLSSLLTILQAIDRRRRHLASGSALCFQLGSEMLSQNFEEQIPLSVVTFRLKTARGQMHQLRRWSI